MATNLKKVFRDGFEKFIEGCIPLSHKEKDNHIYFMSESNQLYGIDMNRNQLFEPASDNKFVLITQAMETYFNDDVKKSLEDKIKIKFTDLIELTVKKNFREKFMGKKFYFNKNEKKIYLWSLVSNKWEKSDVDSMRHLFSNNDVLTDQILVRKSERIKSLDDLGISFDDLEEISLRYKKDASIHYYHKKSNKVYSLNQASNLWYIPTEDIHAKLIDHVNNEKTKLKDMDNSKNEKSS